MPKKAPSDPTLEALREACVDEPSAVAFMETRRWKNGYACPICGSVDVYQMKNRETGARNKDFRWRCKGCSKMYSVRTGTVMEESRLPIRVWCYAFWKACASKKGVSALQISRECEVSYKSALFLMHRIRAAMTDTPEPGPLTGTVEVDETYVGGKPRYRGTKRGRRTGSHTPVVGVVERDGMVKLAHVDSVTPENIRATMLGSIDLKARIMTDQAHVYRNIAKPFEGGHQTVNHGVREYVRGDVHTNTIESVWALVKRSIYGTYHSVSWKHLHRYMAQSQFSWNTRFLEDSQRVETAIWGSNGKRLTYKMPVRKAS